MWDTRSSLHTSHHFLSPALNCMCCLIKASGYTSGDDALDDRETEEEMVKNTQERNHGVTQVGCAGSKNHIQPDITCLFL